MLGWKVATQASKDGKKEVVVQRPEPRFGVVTAILYSDDTPTILIEDQMLHEGDTIHEVKVFDIKADRVLFDSRRGIDLPTRERRLGIVFQDALLFPHLDDLDESVAFFGLWPRSVAARDVLNESHDPTASEEIPPPAGTGEENPQVSPRLLGSAALQNQKQRSKRVKLSQLGEVHKRSGEVLLPGTECPFGRLHIEPLWTVQHVSHHLR